ncbi:hypothetical protein H4582DRAFT_1962372 [Lactarius indigo]|nr:hypothetical protein H4582DRAFT_1962372 [Lactarius indigo]
MHHDAALVSTSTIKSTMRFSTLAIFIILPAAAYAAVCPQQFPVVNKYECAESGEPCDENINCCGENEHTLYLSLTGGILDMLLRAPRRRRYGKCPGRGFVTLKVCTHCTFLVGMRAGADLGMVSRIIRRRRYLWQNLISFLAPASFENREKGIGLTA